MWVTKKNNKINQLLSTKIAVKVNDECEENPCDRCNPCGPNSQCRENNGVAICSCLPGFVGSAPTCRPECVVSSECDRDKACINQKCVNPCINVCGTNAECRVNNHSPFCTCRNGFTGNPFTVCNRVPRMFSLFCIYSLAI